MNADYVAWNGERYVWPPPEGWYLASDGRWWAPDTGPDMDLDAMVGAPIDDSSDPTPSAALRPTDVPPSDSQVAAAQPADQQIAASRSTDAPPAEHDLGIAASGPSLTADSGPSIPPATPPISEPMLMTDPTAKAPPSTTTALSDTGSTTLVMAEHVDLTPPPPMVPDPNGEPSEGVLSAPAGPPTSPPPPVFEATAPPPASRQRSRTLTMVAAGCLVAAALVIAGLLALLGGDNDVQTQQPSASAEGEDSDELVVSTDDSGTPTSSADAMGMEGDSMMDDGSMTDDSMMDGSMTDDSMMDGTATTTAGDDTATSIGALSEEDVAIIGQFRTLLEDNEITAAELTGDDILVFGETACSYATEATDLPGYEQIRNTALGEAQNEELTTEDLRFVVDAAVTVFCAEDAERLGLTLVPPTSEEG